MLSNHLTAVVVAIVLAVGDAQAQGATQADDFHRVATSNTMFAIALRGVAPEVDGILNDEAWDQISPLAFVQREPHPGRRSSQRTGVLVTYDRNAIYIAFRLYDSAPDSIRSQLTRRDTPTEQSDWAHVFLDSYADSRTAFQFSVNPSGVKVDALRHGDTGVDRGWDAVWDVAVRIDSLGWTAELRIPLSQLRYATAPDAGTEMRWGANFGREIARHGELSYWSPISAEDGGFVPQFGHLAGLRGLPAPRRIEIRPYTVSRLTRAPERIGDPFYSANAVVATAGVDVKYSLTSDFTLDLAINPDFGQVEADPSVVNLSAFETFFPEKRAFFLEGTDLFAVTYPSWPPLVYSRRIGRAPRGSAPADAQFALSPDATAPRR